eukprot:2660552-Lingulodinium_polyedra.AAC.1
MATDTLCRMLYAQSSRQVMFMSDVDERPFESASVTAMLSHSIRMSRPHAARLRSLWSNPIKTARPSNRKMFSALVQRPLTT